MADTHQIEHVEPLSQSFPPGLLYSRRASIAKKHGFQVTAEFNALVDDVISAFVASTAPTDEPLFVQFARAHADQLTLRCLQPDEGDAEITSYAVGSCSVDRARQQSGAVQWAVRRDGMVLNKQGEWETEPQPSNRSDDFLERCRFDSSGQAISAARAATSKDAL